MNNIVSKGTLEFDPTEHQIVIGGVIVNDYGNDTKISMDFSELRTVTEGVDGAVSFNERATMTGTFIVRVLQNSPMATLLRNMARVPKGRFPFAYGVKSLGGAGYFTDKAIFTKIPSESITQDAQAIEFEIIAPRMKVVK